MAIQFFSSLANIELVPAENEIKLPFVGGSQLWQVPT
jgi:hypothetical protein